MIAKLKAVSLRSMAGGAILFATAVLSTLAVGCGAELSTDEDITRTDLALGASCGSVSTGVVFNGAIDPMHVSIRTYNSCTKSYVVDVNNLLASYTGRGAGGGPDARFSISYQDTPVTTQADCNGLWGGALLFRKVAGSWQVEQSTVTQTGTWLPGLNSCETPLIEFSGLVAGESYRIAASMRQGGTAGPTRKLGIVNLKRSIIH